MGRFLFIFDGFHELSVPIDLVQNQIISSWPNSKILITTRMIEIEIEI
jgi:hypothetical protein